MAKLTKDDFCRVAASSVSSMHTQDVLRAGMSIDEALLLPKYLMTHCAHAGTCASLMP